MCGIVGMFCKCFLPKAIALASLGLAGFGLSVVSVWGMPCWANYGPGKPTPWETIFGYTNCPLFQFELSNLTEHFIISYFGRRTAELISHVLVSLFR